MKNELTNYLLARGWKRSDEPADFVDECGWSGEETGWCVRPARWSKDYVGCGHLCAQHARMTEQFNQPRLIGT